MFSAGENLVYRGKDPALLIGAEAWHCRWPLVASPRKSSALATCSGDGNGSAPDELGLQRKRLLDCQKHHSRSNNRGAKLAARSARNTGWTTSSAAACAR
jgi:hypothetical protein